MYLTVAICLLLHGKGGGVIQHNAKRMPCNSALGKTVDLY